MPIFNLNKGKLTLVREKPIDLEKDIQKITEDNLYEIFGLDFVSSEFSLQNFRLDTLAFDNLTKSFVILEYKKDKSFSVVDQGFSYLALMLNNKAEFIIEYNEKTGKNLKRDDIEWSESRVIFLANSFTQYQQSAIQFKDTRLQFELWEVKKYDNNTILYNKLISQTSNESIRVISKDKNIDKVTREVKEYTESDILTKNTTGEKLYNQLKEKITLINPALYPHTTKFYIAFRLPDNWRNIFAVWVRKDKIWVDFVRSEPKDFNDPEKRLEYRKDSMKNYNVHISQMQILNEKDLEYATYLLRQLYDRFIVDFPISG